MMTSFFANGSTSLKVSDDESKHMFSKNLGDSEFLKWISSFNPKLLSQYPSLQKESQSKLRSLYSLNLQANSTVDEVLKTIYRCEQEYEALAEKTSDHLHLLGINDDDMSSESLFSLQESAAIILEGRVGDGTDAGAASSLASDFLKQLGVARQKLSLKRNSNMLENKNHRLADILDFLEKECKMALTEVSTLQADGESLNVDVVVPKLHDNVSLSRAELDEHGVSQEISDQAILNIYRKHILLQNEIKLLEEKFMKYGELPPNITEAAKILESKKKLLESLSNSLKLKLTDALRGVAQNNIFL